MGKESFFDKMFPYAQAASQKIDVPVSVILAQWAHESAYGTSNLAQRAGNYAGIKHVSSSIDYGATGAYANYKNNMDTFVKDYIRVLNLSYYDKVRTADSVNDTVEALAASPYAESGYGGGKSILDLIQQYGLTSYDNKKGSGISLDSDSTVVKQIPVAVPDGAGELVVAIAVVAAGLAMLRSLVK